MPSLQPVRLLAAAGSEHAGETDGFLIAQPKKCVEEWVGALAASAALLAAAGRLGCALHESPDAFDAGPDYLELLASRGRLGKDEMPRRVQVLTSGVDVDEATQERRSQLIEQAHEAQRHVLSFLRNEHKGWDAQLAMVRVKGMVDEDRWIRKCHMDKWEKMICGWKEKAAGGAIAIGRAAMEPLLSEPLVLSERYRERQEAALSLVQRLQSEGIFSSNEVAHSVLLIKEPEKREYGYRHTRLFNLRKVVDEENGKRTVRRPVQWEIAYYDCTNYATLDQVGWNGGHEEASSLSFEDPIYKDAIPLGKLRSCQAVITRARHLRALPRGYLHKEDAHRTPVEPSVELTMKAEHGGRVYRLKAYPEHMEMKKQLEQLQTLINVIGDRAVEQLEREKCCEIVSDFTPVLDLADNRSAILWDGIMVYSKLQSGLIQGIPKYLKERECYFALTKKRKGFPVLRYHDLTGEVEATYESRPNRQYLLYAKSRAAFTESLQIQNLLPCDWVSDVTLKNGSLDAHGSTSASRNQLGFGRHIMDPLPPQHREGDNIFVEEDEEEEEEELAARVALQSTPPRNTMGKARNVYLKLTVKYVMGGMSMTLKPPPAPTDDMYFKGHQACTVESNRPLQSQVLLLHVLPSR